MPNGERLVDMTHFDPVHISVHLNSLETAMASHPPSSDKSAFLVTYQSLSAPETQAILTILQDFTIDVNSLVVSRDMLLPLDEYTKGENIFQDQLVFIANQGVKAGNDVIEVGGRRVLRKWSVS